MLLFLEIVGLRREGLADQASELARFKLYHTEFRKLLSANNSFLETVSELENALSGESRADQSFLRRKAVRAASDIHFMVTSLNAIAGGRFASLPEAFDRIASTMTSLLDVRAGDIESVLDLPAIRGSHADLVGGKVANIAELANILHLPTPDGFSVTTKAFRDVIEEGGLRSWMQVSLMDISLSSDLEEVSESLRQSILQAGLPEELNLAIRAAWNRLSARTPDIRRLAVRSSAIGEDSDLSFAGQYLSVLNVEPENIGQAYLEVLASLYSQEAIHYRLLHGLPRENAEMAVGVIGQVDSVASGVAFSRHPTQPDSDDVLIHAVHGLGVSLVEGRTSPEVILVSRTGEPRDVRRFASGQNLKIVAGSDGGVLEQGVSAHEAEQSCLEDDEARRLADWVLQIEAHFGAPQDVEWALDPERRLILLQARPLRLTQSVMAERMIPAPGFPVLVDGGETACPGFGTGPAVILGQDDDLSTFPEGGVLVAIRPSPKFVRLLSRAKAVVTDYGSTTGHMASLAREFRIPALLRTKTATRTIRAGQTITVDANNRYVYLGEVPEPSAPAPSKTASAEILSNGATHQANGAGMILDRVYRLIVPLNLTDPASPEFIPANARTLHDLARYIHEKSFEVMFGLGARMGDMRDSSYLLDIFLPIDLYIIDLGGGLIDPPTGRKINRRHIASVPLNAVLEGMLDKRLPRFGPKPMDLRGFLSVMMKHATENPETDASFTAPSYALISASYLNFTARIGYHFNVVDSYCGATANKNYISMLFRGGAADVLRRRRRVTAIAEILRTYGFAAQVNQDAVSARFSKACREETAEQLTMVGRLLQFFRQMDAAMVGDEAIDWVRDAFLNGNYNLFQEGDYTSEV